MHNPSPCVIILSFITPPPPFLLILVKNRLNSELAHQPQENGRLQKILINGKKVKFQGNLSQVDIYLDR